MKSCACLTQPTIHLLPIQTFGLCVTLYNFESKLHYYIWGHLGTAEQVLNSTCDRATLAFMLNRVSVHMINVNLKTH